MEWCEGGGVDGLMVQHNGKVPLKWAQPIILQALGALAHARIKGFVHRDLSHPLGSPEIVRERLGKIALPSDQLRSTALARLQRLSGL
jgi:serine/threonine protein kinase